jgi:preprotein translocase subunit SecD
LNFKYLGLLILVVALLAGAGYYSMGPLSESISLGLDIRGGVTVLLEAVPTPDNPVINDDAMSRAVAIITQRVNGLGVAEAEVVREGATRIRVSLPDYDDQEQAMSILGRTARLAFRDGEFNVLVYGDNLLDARERLTDRNEPYVSITFDSAAGEIMRQYTGDNVGGYLFITLDDEVISMPQIQMAVGAEAMISNMGSLQEARNLAIMLRSGALPVALEVRDFRAVGPSLGMSSLLQTINAAYIGIALVVLFMLFFYRGFGFAATLALSAYVIIVLWTLAGINATLTLPGVAGIILGVGMAVDANVIVFERIKEEMRGGKSLRVSIAAGFRRAIWTVLDANVTTLIGAGVLYYFGTGPVRGFAVTLSISILVSMLSAIFITRMLMFLLVNTKLVKSDKALGGI